jgi:hypothetical protein
MPPQPRWTGYPIRETADGVAVLGEKLTPITRGGLTLAGIMLHGWVSKALGRRIPEKPYVAD